MTLKLEEALTGYSVQQMSGITKSEFVATAYSSQEFLREALIRLCDLENCENASILSTWGKTIF